uniref:Uncharacterized protein LOC111127042 n=1 Tax=Crassostrea virginica TaxID=6565 RepID=A0A8B8DHX5_CRAVI|nr:uncharacterized protein LOC111127042 [Crassostrea virginica]
MGDVEFHHLFPIHHKIHPEDTHLDESDNHHVHHQRHIEDSGESPSYNHSSINTSKDQLASSKSPDRTRKCRKPTPLSLIVSVFLLLILGVALLLYYKLSPSDSDENPSKYCKQLPASFGNDCQYRCHCLNSTEICDKTTGRCKSGCMHGWMGTNCQIISSIFNTVTINAKSHSRHIVTCSIFKLWYNWMNVYLFLDNGTKAYTLVNVSNNGVVSVSDQRLNATLQKGGGTDEPDNVSFVFEFPEEACDLEGTYTCQFKMVENFNTKFAVLSVFVEARPNITEFNVEDYYYRISNHSLSCSATFASNPTNDIKLEICLGSSYMSITDDPAFTLSQSSDVKTLGKCSYQKTVFYTFDFALVSNGTFLRCVATDQNLNITITTLCGILVLRSPDISVTVEPKYQSTVPGSTVEILCHANVSYYEWKEIHFDYTNDTTSVRMLSIVPTDSSRIFGNNANATVLSKNDNVNISFFLLTTEVVPFCNTKMELTCNFEFLDKTLGRKNDTGTVIVKAPPTNLTIALENDYVDGIYSTINCTANMDPNNTMLFLVGKETTGHEPIMAPTINVQTFVEQSKNCSPKVRVVYPADFTFLRSNSILACVAFDKDYGQNFTSEYKTPSIIIIN